MPVPSLVSVGLVEPMRSIEEPVPSVFFVSVTVMATSSMLSMTEPASMLVPVIVIPGVRPVTSVKVMTFVPSVAAVKAAVALSLIPKPLAAAELKMKFFAPLTVTESGRTAAMRLTAVLVASLLKTTSKPSV